MENNFAGKHSHSFFLPRSRGKIEKSFSPNLIDYFIQQVRNKLDIFFNFFFFQGGFPPFILAKNPNTVFRTMDPSKTFSKYVIISTWYTKNSKSSK